MKAQMRAFASPAAIALAILLGSPDRAAAQSQEDVGAVDTNRGLEEIVVTAERREENLQDVPIAATALTGDQLQPLLAYLRSLQ